MGNSESQNTESKDSKPEYSVLPDSVGGGPKGLGDPEDREIRTLEKELIYKMMREEAKNLCPEEDQKFIECLKTSGFWVNKCTTDLKALKHCQIKWFENKEFEEMVTNKYLEQRAHFRRYGRTAAEEKEYQKWIKEKQEQQQHNTAQTS